MLFRFWKRLSKQDGRSFPGTSVKVTRFMLSPTKTLFPNAVTRGCRVFLNQACRCVFCSTGCHWSLQARLDSAPQQLFPAETRTTSTDAELHEEPGFGFSSSCSCLQMWTPLAFLCYHGSETETVRPVDSASLHSALILNTTFCTDLRPPYL